VPDDDINPANAEDAARIRAEIDQAAALVAERRAEAERQAESGN
jgi:hypothetical protein